MRGAVILCAFVTAAAAQPLTPRPLAISGVTVIDPHGGTAVSGVTVVVREGRITSIGTDTVIPRDSTKIDGRGKFLMPGFGVLFTKLNAVPPEYTTLTGLPRSNTEKV